MKHWIIALMLPAAAFGQDTNSLKTFTISDERIETSVMESGRNVQVITRAQLESMPVSTVQEALQFISGVDLRQRGAWGAQADVSMRGGTFDQCLVLVNGFKMSDPQTGHHAMNMAIDMQSVERIEVVKGPAAARYGINSFSGVINIITRPEQENGVTVSTSVASMEQANLPDAPYAGFQVATTAHVGSKQSRHSIGVNKLSHGGYRPNTDIDRTMVHYQSSTETKLGTFQAVASMVQNAFGASGYYAFPIDSTSEEQVQTWMAGIRHEVDLGPVRLSSKLYSRKNFDEYTLFRNAPAIYQNRHRTDVEGAELHAAWKHALGTTGGGIEFRHEAISSSNLGQHQREFFGGFAEHQMVLLDQRLALQGGAYVNYSNAFGWQVLPSASANYLLSANWALFVTSGRSFRVPTFTDLYYVGPTNVGNAELKPEQSWNSELGIKLDRGAHTAQASVFYQRSYDLIDWVRGSENDPWQPLNYENVATQGVDFNYTMVRSIQLGTPQLQLSQCRVGYTWLHMDALSDGQVDSRYAFSQLRHQFLVQPTLQIGDHLSITASARYLERHAQPAYSLLDARLQYQRTGVRCWVDANNLLDTDYVEAGNAPMPGRWYRVGVEVDL